jgi:uncharacterized protein (DUF342 family)
MYKDNNQVDISQKTATSDLPTRQEPVAQNQKLMVPDNPYSGNVLLTFFDDDLETRADFIPPIGAGAPLTVERVHDFLKYLNIIYGVQTEAIQKAVSDCALTKQPVKNVLIARGDPPIHEIIAYFEINSRLIPAAPSVKKNGQIDYREYSPFIIVKKDQALAKLRPRVEGRAGKNIHNTPIPYKTIYPKGVIGGDHTRTDEKYIIAEINGQFIQEKNRLHVQDRLIIKGGVGYATGNITFPGDVIIDGPVSDGFKIYSEGSVTIKQTLDVTEVMTKGDLNVSGGIIGRGRSIVKVGGAIRTKFIENCHAACRKTITVETEIINSRVFTMERLDLGEKSFIIGSDITAIHGIRVGNIGKKTGKSSKLHCGIDFTVQQEIERNNSQLQLLSTKEKKIRELMALSPANPEKQVKLEVWLHRIAEEQYKLQNRLWDLMGRLNVNEHAAVEVYGEIAPGTLIEICQIALFVAEPLRRVRIKLDTFFGKLVPQPL